MIRKSLIKVPSSSVDMLQGKANGFPLLSFLRVNAARYLLRRQLCLRFGLSYKAMLKSTRYAAVECHLKFFQIGGTRCLFR